MAGDQNQKNGFPHGFSTHLNVNFLGFSPPFSATKRTLRFDQTGYKGTAMITPCSASGQPYKISGCTPKMCLAPTELEKQDYQATDKPWPWVLGEVLLEVIIGRKHQQNH